MRPFASTHPLSLFALVLVLAASHACEAPPPTGVEPPEDPSLVLWGLNSCPECVRRGPRDTESIAMHEAITMHVDHQCVDNALGPGSMSWLEDQIVSMNIWIDEDVHTMPEWDYAHGYWVAPSIRYQYYGIPIYVAQHTIDDYSRKVLAESLIHELGHEMGYNDPDDEGIVEAIAQLCTH